MGLSMKERRAVANELSGRYRQVSKKGRGRLLEEFVSLTGYTRSYAAHLLCSWGKREVRILNGRRTIVIVGHSRGKVRRRRARTYDEPVLGALKQLWLISDGLCGKRLVCFMRAVIPILERFEEISLDEVIREKLLRISAATVDRLLAPVRKSYQLKRPSATKPGTLLKHHIPIRTFADWSERIPGFVETDLVAHDGGSSYGDFIHTVNVTDVATGWTELKAVPTKAQRYVFEALREIQRRIPFPLRGIDSDNGSEFINNHLLRFCEANRITFTRSRPYRKNDTCYVEQKNYSIVRRASGYGRYDSPEALTVLEELYGQLRLYTNFFQPVMKLREKTRIASKVTRHYDEPRTP